MSQRNHPFPFDARAEGVMKAFIKETGERLRQAQSQVGAGGNVQRFNHGGSWQSHHSYDPDRVDEMQTLEHETRLDMEEIMVGRLEVIEQTVNEISNAMAASYAQFFYQMISDTCEEHGNVIDAGGRSLGEQMLEAIQNIEFSVGRDGKVSLPEFRVNTETAKLLETDPSIHSPDLLARFEETSKLKVTEALEKEAVRKAKFWKEEE